MPCARSGATTGSSSGARASSPGALVEPLGTAGSAALLVAGPGAEAHADRCGARPRCSATRSAASRPTPGSPPGGRWLWQAFARLAEAREHGAVLSVVARAIGSALGLACVQVGEIVEGELALAQTWLRDERSRERALDGPALAALADGRRVRAQRRSRRLPARPAAAHVDGYARLPRRLRRRRAPLPADVVDDSALLVAHAAVALESLRAFERKESEAATDALTGLPTTAASTRTCAA